ncbi:beta-ketoacyl-ACP synthase FabY [Sessilibacter sp. MAH1]
MTLSARLPVIVGFGGYNAAGRTSFHHGYKRLVIDSIDSTERNKTIAGLAVLMGYAKKSENGYIVGEQSGLSLEQTVGLLETDVLANTLIRRIDKDVYFDVDNVKWHKKTTLDSATGEAIEFKVRTRDLPEPLPEGWEIIAEDGKTTTIAVSSLSNIKVDSYRDFPVKSAGQLPKGFDISSHYNSHFHPRALQMAVLGASDAIRSVGIDWQDILKAVSPDEIGVYASNIMAQLDEHGAGGMLQSRLLGSRVSTKNLILGLNSMTTDFINAYVIGSVGSSASITGACASFLYNMNTAIEEIRSGRKRVVIVGGCEAPVTSEIIDGYATMGALATEDAQKRLYNVDEVDHSRSSRPFSDNCGFTIAESSQFTVLMDDELALELGAQIHGSVAGVFLNSDGYKKSISAPGAGNYLTMARAVASAQSMFGKESVQSSILLAHGSSTPKNRETESVLFDEVAKTFGIENWPTIAIKAFLGHSLAPASGDQVNAALGMFKYKVLPGIRTADNIADDVARSHLNIFLDDIKVEHNLDLAFINSKGFGGANATGILVSPEKTLQMLEKRWGSDVLDQYFSKLDATVTRANEYDQSALAGDLQVIYQFGEGVIEEDKIEMTTTSIRVPGFENPISLEMSNLYKDML